jgi:hypothetical protein
MDAFYITIALLERRLKGYRIHRDSSVREEDNKGCLLHSDSSIRGGLTGIYYAQRLVY